MKKIKWLALSMLLSAGLSTLLPCDISFETAKIVENGKNKTHVKVLVDIVHGRCPVDIEKTSLACTGIKVEKKGQWKKIDASTWQLEFNAVPSGSKAGEVCISRDCPKRGLHSETLKIDPQ
jgi:hypothetical protein